jgi:hypothetical protein
VQGLLPIPSSHLARVQHALKGRLLGSSDSKAVAALDLDPSCSIVTVDTGQSRLPAVRALVTLLGVGGGSDSPKLRALDVVGESLALGRGPA